MVKKYSILLVILILAILGLGCTRKESKESLAKTEDPIKAEDSIKTEDSVKVEDPVKAENPKKAEDQEKADGSVTADDPTKTEGNRESDIGTEKESLRKSTSQQIGSGRRCFYRNMFMVSEMIDGSFYAGPVYLGELTVDNVLSEGDFYLSSFFDSAIMWRGVKENMTSIVYTYYCPNWKQIGDYDEYGENEKAEILKSEIIYDKETHRITQESIVIHSVDIPDTKLYIPEPV